MKRDAIETDEYEADFAAQGEVEFEETEAEDSEHDMDLLLERVKAARFCGA
jgi:hypothetical protein